MIAAVRAVRSQNPARIVVATPVAAPSAVELLREETDELAILDTPSDFYSISQFYADFPQISDAEVYSILSRSAKVPAEPDQSAAS